MLRKKYDVVVIGGGPVGVTSALRASSLGYKCLIVDATPPRKFQFTGPTGLYSKALRDSALRLDVGILRSMGIVDTAIWAQVCGSVEAILRKSGDNNAGALSLSRVPHLRGFGSLRRVSELDGDTSNEDADGRCVIEVRMQRPRAGNNRGCQSVTLRADHVLLATGSQAVRLPALKPYYDASNLVGGHVRCYDSDSIRKLSFLPRAVVVVGGGIIAIEFARIFAALAADVTMVVRASDVPSSLARVGIDRAIGFVLQEELQAAGVKLLFDAEITSAAPAAASSGGGSSTAARGVRAAATANERLRLTVCHSRTRAERPPLEADCVLSATGRKAVTQGLGLDSVGVEIAANGDVVVDSTLQTAAAGVFAAGDLIGAPQLASTGIAQAEAAIDAMFGRAGELMGALGVKPMDEGKAPVDFSPSALLANAARYPIGIWTVPELAFVGLTSAAAVAPPHNLDVVEGVGRYSQSIRGHVHTVGTRCEGEYLPPSEYAVAQLSALAAELSECAIGDTECTDALAEQKAGKVAHRAKDVCCPLSGPSLKLVVERAAPHVIVGVHVFGEDACELIHFGTTLVQGRKTVADVLAVCYAAVTYHELYKLAARDAIATLQCDAWRELYRRLDTDLSGTLEPAEVRSELKAMGADDETTEDLVKALFLGKSLETLSSPEQFVKRAQRLASPQQLGLLEMANPSANKANGGQGQGV